MERIFDDKNQLDHISKLTTISTRLVEPDVKNKPEWIEWSPLDLLWQTIYSSYFFLYKPGSEVADGDTVLPFTRLIESLSKALVHFHPFAGRLIKNSKDEPVRLYCNNEGAVFTHKRYDGIVSELIDEDQFRPNELISGLNDLVPTATTYEPSGLPTLIIQVTEFQCGTRCLSTSWSHMVADGFSGLHFLTSWAQISRGESISLMPVHNRSLLSPRKSSPILDGGPARFLNTWIKSLEGDKIEITIPEEGAGSKTVKFSRRKMDELKNEGREGLNQSIDGHGRVLSSADCMGAHFWRMITDARKHEPHELTRYTALVNARSRMKDFPAGYFGNLIVVPSTVTTVGELLSKPPSYAATIIHDAIKAVNDDLVRDWIDWFSLNQHHMLSMGDDLFMSGNPNFNLHNIHASWQHRFPFFEIDFGSGKPSTAIRNAFRMSYFSLGMFFALPTSSTTNSVGDIRITVFAENSVLSKLCDQL